MDPQVLARNDRMKGVLTETMPGAMDEERRRSHRIMAGGSSIPAIRPCARFPRSCAPNGRARCWLTGHQTRRRYREGRGDGSKSRADRRAHAYGSAGAGRLGLPERSRSFEQIWSERCTTGCASTRS